MKADEKQTEIQNVILYARVSSQRQADRDLSTSAQLRALRAFAHERGWRVVAQFVDRAKTGRDAHRPGLQRMLATVRRGGVDALLIWKIDRLARNVEVSAAIAGSFASTAS